ncbi:MAG TPA: hypothetical protein PLN53_15485, partial [Terricaulis sp.]|nr:hypothetical protein [Terricaulis sp.]
MTPIFFGPDAHPGASIDLLGKPIVENRTRVSGEVGGVRARLIAAAEGSVAFGCGRMFQVSARCGLAG